MKSIQHLAAVVALAGVLWWTQDNDRQFLLLAVIMLCLPMLDLRWRPRWICTSVYEAGVWLISIVVAVVLLSHRPETVAYLLVTLFFVALPEEVFFRTYLMQRLGQGIWANLAASVLFACMHLLATADPVSLLVIFPSLLFGYLYQRDSGLIAISMLHASFNLIHHVYLGGWINRFM